MNYEKSNNSENELESILSSDKSEKFKRHLSIRIPLLSQKKVHINWQE